MIGGGEFVYMNTKLFSCHALFSLTIPLTPFLNPKLLPLVTLIIFLYAFIFFTVFYFRNQIKPYRLADLITAFRLLIAVFILFITPLNFIPYFAIFLIIVFAEALDGLDGKIARKFGTTPFGAIWDMETDAFFILILSYISVFYLNYPWWILGFGLIRFLFYFIFYYLKPDNVDFPESLSMFSKTICVCTVLILSLFWIIPIIPGIFLGFINLLLLSISFLWEGGFYLKLRFQTKNL
jgi:hypothetical protein